MVTVERIGNGGRIELGLFDDLLERGDDAVHHPAVETVGSVKRLGCDVLFGEEGGELFEFVIQWAGHDAEFGAIDGGKVELFGNEGSELLFAQAH